MTPEPQPAPSGARRPAAASADAAGGSAAVPPTGSAESEALRAEGLAPLDADALRAALVRPAGPWEWLEVLPEVGSTNTELARRAREGAAIGGVLATEHQSAGRGRLDRTFTTPPGAALTVSLLLRPQVPADRLGWLPLLMGVAAVRAAAEAGVAAALKWPNDVLAGHGKLAGILAEVVPLPDGAAGPAGPAVVLGIGMNVAQRAGELPVNTAASLLSEGAVRTSRMRLLTGLLAEFDALYGRWTGAGGDAERSGLAAAYRDRCDTLGRAVRARLPGGRTLEGTAGGIDGEGRLSVTAPGGSTTPLSAADIVHLRRREQELPGGTG
ncbi:biotin--[acetyl-CoA-carboxylase] ligase [Nocardiopsis coralliicola]